MDSMMFVVLLLVTNFTTVRTLTLEVTSDVVTVREGEKLNLSCSITLDGQGIREVRWYRGSNQEAVLYGSIDVTNCGFFPLCTEVNTTDNRGVVQFTRSLIMHDHSTLTLVIDHTLARDNTSFSCGLGTTTNTFLSSDDIHVIVQHLIIDTGDQTTAGFLPSTEQTTAGLRPYPTTTTTPRNDLRSTDQTTTPFLDGTSTTLTTNKVITQSDSPLNTIVIAAIASACLVVIIILLIIIACLVSSRRTRSKGDAKTNPNDLSIRLSVAITSPGSNTNLSHEAHVYANEIVPALSSSNRPGRLEIPPCDHTASYPPSPLYAAVSSVKKAPQIGDGSYAVVSKRDKRRGNSPLEHQPNMGHGSQDPPEYHTLEPGARQLSQAGQEPESTEGQFEYAIPGQGSRSWRSSQLDEDDGKLIDNVLYTTQNEYM